MRVPSGDQAGSISWLGLRETFVSVPVPSVDAT